MNGENLDILFVIVLYKCKLENSLTYSSILKSLNNTKHQLNLLVYDNSPEYNLNFIAAPSNIIIKYVTDNVNSGVSKAYNIGAKVATTMGKKWLVLLDQDSNFPSESIVKYEEGINSFPSIMMFAPLLFTDNNKVISPCYKKFGRGFYTKNNSTGIRFLNTYSPINSGMCIALSAFNKLGGYNENIQLDFSDYDFVNRYRKNISNKFVVLNIVVRHQLSSQAVNSFESDFYRFRYYLQGGKFYAKTKLEVFFIKLNAFLRACKLSLLHKKIAFLKLMLSN